MFKRQFLAFLLIFSLIAPFFYLPQQAKRTEAFLGFGDLVIDVKALAERIVDGIAMTAAQIVVDRMVQATVKWAQSGFEGNPSYVVDPEQYFTDLADGIAGEFIAGSDLGYLCSPFQANIRLSLAQQYYEAQPFQCTMTEVVGNIDAFFDDFSQGGWDAWITMTQNPTNNPYGAYLEAKVELDSRIASAVNLQREQLNWNQGFMSWSRCIATNPPPTVESASQVEIGSVSNPATGGNLSSSNFQATGQTLGGRVQNTKHVPGKAVGECIERGPVETPGATVKAQLDKVLPSGLEKLISAEHVEQLINAFASGLLQKFVFGPKGIFARDNPVGASTGGGANDIDGDGTPDGMDTDGNGTLDVCYFGGADGSPNGKPCLGSGRASQTEPPNEEAQCPIPDTPRSLCDNVSASVVMEIVNRYRPSNAGIRAAIQEINTIYPDARILEHPVRLDKIDFGGGLVVDIIVGAVGGSDDAEGTGWAWNVDCQCGGPVETTEPDQTP
jgi:hypothetical protein